MKLLQRVKWNHVILTMIIPVLALLNLNYLKIMILVFLGVVDKTALDGCLFLVAELVFALMYLHLKYNWFFSKKDCSYFHQFKKEGQNYDDYKGKSKLSYMLR